MALQHFLCSLLSLGVLTACLHPKPDTLKVLHYLNKDPLFLPVRNITFCFPEKNSDNICVSDVSLLNMLEQWGQNYLTASGETPYVLTISFKNISIAECPLTPEKRGLTSMLYIQSREKYVASLDVLCLLTKDTQKKTMTLHIEVEQEIPENYTPLQRKTVLLSLYTDIVNRVSQNIEEKLYEFIKS